MFLDEIELLLNKKGTTRNKLLIDLNLNRSSFNDWKRRGTTPNGETLTKIANYFGCTVDYLLGNTDDPDTESRTVATRSMNPDKAGVVVHDIKDLFKDGKEDTVTEDVKYVDADEFFKDSDKIGKAQLTIETKDGEKAKYILSGEEAEAVKKIVEVLKKNKEGAPNDN